MGWQRWLPRAPAGKLLLEHMSASHLEGKLWRRGALMLSRLGLAKPFLCVCEGYEGEKRLCLAYQCWPLVAKFKPVCVMSGLWEPKVKLLEISVLSLETAVGLERFRGEPFTTTLWSQFYGICCFLAGRILWESCGYHLSISFVQTSC